MNVLSITQLNNLIKRTIDREYLLKNVYVSGTITNAKRHSSGHVYFSLNKLSLKTLIIVRALTHYRRLTIYSCKLTGYNSSITLHLVSYSVLKGLCLS